MKKDTWFYLLKLATEDFINKASDTQKNTFIAKHPNFALKPMPNELYVTMLARIEKLVNYMKDESIGHFDFKYK